MSEMDKYPALRVIEEQPPVAERLRVTGGEDVTFRGWQLATAIYMASSTPFGELTSATAYRTVGGKYLLKLVWPEGMGGVRHELQVLPSLELLIQAVPMTTVGKRLRERLGVAPVRHID